MHYAMLKYCDCVGKETTERLLCSWSSEAEPQRLRLSRNHEENSDDAQDDRCGAGLPASSNDSPQAAPSLRVDDRRKGLALPGQNHPLSRRRRGANHQLAYPGSEPKASFRRGLNLFFSPSPGPRGSSPGAPFWGRTGLDIREKDIVRAPGDGSRVKKAAIIEPSKKTNSRKPPELPVLPESSRVSGRASFNGALFSPLSNGRETTHVNERYPDRQMDPGSSPGASTIALAAMTRALGDRFNGGAPVLPVGYTGHYDTPLPVSTPGGAPAPHNTTAVQMVLSSASPGMVSGAVCGAFHLPYRRGYTPDHLQRLDGCRGERTENPPSCHDPAGGQRSKSESGSSPGVALRAAQKLPYGCDALWATLPWVENR